jgi:hypothetical protein
MPTATMARLRGCVCFRIDRSDTNVHRKIFIRKTMFSDANPESRLAVACCLWPSGEKRAARIKILLREYISRDRFLCLTERLSRLGIRFLKDFAYWNAGRCMPVEAFWQPFDNLRLGETNRQISLHEWVERVPGLLLFHLSTHSASHARFRLKWMADIAGLRPTNDPSRHASLHARHGPSGRASPAARRNFFRTVLQVSAR